MAEVTSIAWTHSTFNPWIGCTKVGPGCDHCYAEALDRRHRWGGATHWGTGVPRKRTSEAYWRQPLSWNRKAKASGKPWRVFCASLADVFDNEAPEEWRRDLFELISDTPALTWLLLTKRIGNAARMMRSKPFHNVWIGATIVNQEEADRDVPKLLTTPAAKRFVSYEPALGPVDWAKFQGIDWLIIGGESKQGPGTRWMPIEWAEYALEKAREVGAAPFVKQLGSKNGFKDHAGADPSEWPEHLRVQDIPQ